MPYYPFPSSSVVVFYLEGASNRAYPFKNNSITGMLTGGFCTGNGLVKEAMDRLVLSIVYVLRTNQATSSSEISPRFSA